MNFIGDYIHHAWPHLPGGALTIGILSLVMVGLLMLYKRTGWGGWMAWFVAIGTYSVPFLTEFHA